MATPDGYLYSREALLENLLQQKKAIKRKLAAYEAQQQDEQQKVRVHPHAAAGSAAPNEPTSTAPAPDHITDRQQVAAGLPDWRPLPSTHRRSVSTC